MREQWGSQAGFILAAIGSAVGLGNIWRFAYVAGENGGGAFLVVYLVIVLTIGLPLVIAEISIGKRTGADGVTAFERLAPASPWRRVGWLGVAGSALILAYYSVIAGWALRYFFAAAGGTLWERPPGGFAESFHGFIGHPLEPLGWHVAMMVLSMAVVLAGVARGIERACLWLMPMLALIVPVDLGQQQDELVAAGSGDRVGVAQAGAEPHRHRLEQPVADHVDEPVVDVLEVVEVQHEQGAARPVVGDPALVLAQCLLEGAAVQQPGERIVVGEVVQLGGRLAAVGDVEGLHQ